MKFAATGLILTFNSALTCTSVQLRGESRAAGAGSPSPMEAGVPEGAPHRLHHEGAGGGGGGRVSPILKAREIIPSIFGDYLVFFFNIF